MWPFKKAPVTPNQDTSAYVEHQGLIALFRHWKPIGSKFEYLGRTMVVTGHSRFVPRSFSRACVTANYVDDLGVIHNITFDEEEVKALMR